MVQNAIFKTPGKKFLKIFLFLIYPEEYWKIKQGIRAIIILSEALKGLKSLA